MKCISLKQPYAELLVSGKKTIECRTWSTRFRGDFLIHASKTVDIEACTYYKLNINLVVTGFIIGKALVYDIKKYVSNEEFVLDKNKHLSLQNLHNNKIIYGFLIKDAVRFARPIPYLGKLGFFEVDEF
jgi:hypothetical protein